MFDDIMLGNAYFEIVTDQAKTYLQFFHIDASTCRIASDLTSIILHPNWRDYKGSEDKLRVSLPLYPYFELMEDGQYHSIYHIKVYEPEFSNYGLPKWYSGLASVIIAGLTDQWNKDRLESQFNGDGVLVIPGVNTAEDAVALDTKLDKFIGSAANPNATNLLVQYLSDLGPGQTREKVQYIPFDIQTDGSWIDLHTSSYNNLLSVHNWFKTLCSFYGDKTGFDTHRILNEYEIALNTIIKQFQRRYLDIFKPIFINWGFDPSELDFENQMPVYRISPVSYVWEVRRDSGLPFDDKDPKQQIFFAELKNTFISENDNPTDNKPGSSGKNS